MALIVLLYNALESNLLTQNVNAFTNCIYKQFQGVFQNKSPKMQMGCKRGDLFFTLSLYLHIFVAHLKVNLYKQLI